MENLDRNLAKIMFFSWKDLREDEKRWGEEAAQKVWKRHRGNPLGKRWDKKNLEKMAIRAAEMVAEEFFDPDYWQEEIDFEEWVSGVLASLMEFGEETLMGIAFRMNEPELIKKAALHAMELICNDIPTVVQNRREAIAYLEKQRNMMEDKIAKA